MAVFGTTITGCFVAFCCCVWRYVKAIRPAGLQRISELGAALHKTTEQVVIFI